jgi:SSS family solute:Na+ symporter
VNRVTTLLVSIVTLVISLVVSDVVGALTVAYDLLTGALFVPIVGALFWRRATAAGALASMAAGSVVVVVSFLTPRPSEERMRAWERRLEGPGTPS